MVGLSVTIGGQPANITRIADPNDFFVLIPYSLPVATTTLTVSYSAGGPTPPSQLLSQSFDVLAPAAGTPTLQVTASNPSRGGQLLLTGASLPPGAQLGVTIGGIVQALAGASSTSLTVQVDPGTPTGSQPIEVTWYDPTRGPLLLLSDTLTVQ